MIPTASWSFGFLSVGIPQPSSDLSDLPHIPDEFICCTVAKVCLTVLMGTAFTIHSDNCIAINRYISGRENHATSCNEPVDQEQCNVRYGVYNTRLMSRWVTRQGKCRCQTRTSAHAIRIAAKRTEIPRRTVGKANGQST